MTRLSYLCLEGNIAYPISIYFYSKAEVAMNVFISSESKENHMIVGLEGVTGQEVWEALLNDPNLADQESFLPVLQQIVEAVPLILTEELPLLVTFETLLQCRVKFIQYLLDHDFVAKAINLLPESDFDLMDREDVAVMMQSGFETIVQLAGPILANVGEFLADQGMTDAEIVLSSTTGLNIPMRNSYRAGTLTIEELMRRQPGVILLENGK